jgi:NADH dehydrogenase
LELVFPRDLGILQTDHSQRIARAYYRPGDFIYRRGDPANFFYAIEQGEVEVLRNADGPQPDTPFALLGPGEFLGETALGQDPAYLANVRARTAVRLVVMSREVFSERGGTMAPVRDTLAESVKRRSENVWLRVPDAREILSREPLSFFLEPVPASTLKPESTIGEAIDLLTSSTLGFIFVLDDQGCLYNVLKGIDLTRAIERLAYLQTDDWRDLRKLQLKEFLSFEPLAVSADDSSLLAASIMYERGLSLIPVIVSKGDRRLKGHVRAETVSYKLLQQLGRRAAAHG